MINSSELFYGADYKMGLQHSGKDYPNQLNDIPYYGYQKIMLTEVGERE
jgi:hypothetical protein